MQTQPDTLRRPLASHRLDDVVFVACGLSCVTGLLHVQAAFDHVSEDALFAAFFVVVALGQFAWAVLAYRNPSRRVLAFGAVANLLVAALWVLSRTRGVPLGPERWEPEAVGPPDVIATVDEVLIAICVAASFHPRRVLTRVVLGAGVFAITLACMTLLHAPHSH